MSGTQCLEDLKRAQRLASRSYSTFGLALPVPNAPHDVLRRFLLLKYLQMLLLPVGNELLLAVGVLASLHSLLLLFSTQLSRKASTVLLGQLAWADGLLLLRWSLGLRSGVGPMVGGLPSGEDAAWVPWLQRSLLEAHGLASLLLLSFVSLEALLVSRWALQSRHLRTVRCARLASALVWSGVAVPLGLQLVAHCLQAAEPETGEYSQWGSVSAMFGTSAWFSSCAAAVAHVLMLSMQSALWLFNTWILFTVFHRKPSKGKSCFH